MMSQVPDSDPWILWSVLVASGANVLMGCLSFCFLIAPDASEEGTRIVVKTFAPMFTPNLGLQPLFGDFVAPRNDVSGPQFSPLDRLVGAGGGGANLLMGCLSFCFLVAPGASEEGPRIAVKTFANSSLKFGTSCSICLADLDDGQLVGQLRCGHTFHEPCI
eukprot:CAMPEP_0179117482 /NCGR_PEP_ID=MMETSP0796-20121207/55184_1 /TAXON_ID=73915 /ORGANISM="Pyrodinium bahamense, Strain pbaha01" /LENGTH=161 /DNA_ID=CAMNT_0020815857 /DNA_START=193 /DNA_END=677 /DNA_ORIENTATION=+